ncbi:polysaccharide export outer membrane protein [Ruegeria intermedia]|uniref:Polysaccharide export outer membrane protein n=2 Tax=Ruegeria intermedia TaxID=996115 RepID=A0A1M5B445_9RHOB|nr:polysaccharide export outer membrane protein [Ruegeria intermedia]
MMKMMKKMLPLVGVLLLASCGVVYHSSTISEGETETVASVRVVPVTAETVQTANRSTYVPRKLPAAFFATTGSVRGPRVEQAQIEPAFLPERRPNSLETRIPPEVPRQPYKIGVGDKLLLATPSATTSVEQLSGLLAAENRRQGYTVQDDGTISIPDIGRVVVAGRTLEEAESAVFDKLVAAGVNPAFSLEIAEFNSQRVTIGGAVKNATVVPLTLTPLRLNQAINAAGGFNLTDRDYASVRIYRDGKLYQIPVGEYLKKGSLQNLVLQDGDSVFVDTDFELEKASEYFAQQIQLSNLRQATRKTALEELEFEIELRRAALEEQRESFAQRLAVDAVDRDFVYLVGEVFKQARYPLPFERKAVLADALFGGSSGFASRTGNPRQIYILRSDGPHAGAGVTAWNLDATNAANFVLATRMELRPNDIIFVAEQPITKWNRVLTQLAPNLVTSSVASAVN